MSHPMIRRDVVTLTVADPKAVLDWDRSLAFLTEPETRTVKRGDEVVFVDLEGAVFASARVVRTCPVVIGPIAMSAEGHPVYAGEALRDYPDYAFDRDWSRDAGAKGYREMIDQLEAEHRIDLGFDKTVALLAVWWDRDSIEPTGEQPLPGETAAAA